MASRDQLIRDVLFFLKDDFTSNITDPISSSRGNTSKFIMTSFPEREVKYPLITLEVSNYEATRAGMQTTNMDITLSIEIRIWSLSVTQSDQLAQQIADRLSDIQFTGSGSIDNDFHDFSIDSMVRVDDPGERGTKSRVFQINYKFFST